MKPCTSLSLVAALFLAACSAPTSPSTFQDSSSTAPSSSTTTSESPTEPAPTPAPVAPAAVEPSKPAETCDFGTKTDAGCQVTYTIDVSAAAAKLPQTCNEGMTAYNDCSGQPLELSWKDIGDRAPKSATLELGVSIYCASPDSDDHHQSIAVNGGEIGGFDADIASCSCNATTNKYSFDVSASALQGFKPGGDNSLTVSGQNRCMGVGGLDGTHTVARIVVTY